ncbi:MAG: malto-oligosyltrehalose trehalohydrolase [Clostridia bacterium]|nr:malto-oligosyltrehalose trehalohydrolase [Deltaproteobacteria bacterium]
MSLRLGAHAYENAWSFCVWAPKAKAVELVILDGPERESRRLPMKKVDRGYFELVTDAIRKDGLYKYALHTEGKELGVYPDPASRSLPFGVHGPSRCVELPVPLATGPSTRPKEQVIYELHVGTLTKEGTLAAMERELPRLADLGVTTLDLMPLAQTAGGRNWGYDGVYPFSVSHRYGGPEALLDFVQKAHAMGLEVMLDVVYNHLGPEGNYLPAYGHYFNTNVHTPWGPALNFEAAHSDEVRKFFIASAEQWVTDYDVDGLRLDAVHELQDRRAVTFLAELNDGVHTQAAIRGKRMTVLAESDANDPRYVTPSSELGLGCDIMYAEDLHHALHVALTGETRGYYQDFVELDHVAKALKYGISYDGQYAPSRGRRHGRPVHAVAPEKLLVFTQNHDQVGNRAAGDRLTKLAGLDAQRAAAMCILLSPYTPFLWMGEEYGETAPFQYFVEHGDAQLVEAVRKGRREEFAQFGWKEEVPDPQAESTFERSKINPRLGIDDRKHAAVLATYKALLNLRRELTALADMRDARIVADTRVVRFTRGAAQELVSFVNLSKEAVSFCLEDDLTAYTKRIDLQELGESGESLPDAPKNGTRVELPAFGGVAYVKRTRSTQSSL